MDQNDTNTKHRDESPSDFAHLVRERLEASLSGGLKSNDARFYNVASLVHMARHFNHFSPDCPDCRDMSGELDQLTTDVAKNFSDTHARRQYERQVQRFAKHLLKSHNIRHMNYYVHLFTFYGLIVGLLLAVAALATLGLAGIRVSGAWGWIAGASMTGMTAGRVLGSRKERKLRQTGDFI